VSGAFDVNSPRRRRAFLLVPNAAVRPTQVFARVENYKKIFKNKIYYLKIIYLGPLFVGGEFCSPWTSFFLHWLGEQTPKILKSAFLKFKNSAECFSSLASPAAAPVKHENLLIDPIVFTVRGWLKLIVWLLTPTAAPSLRKTADVTKRIRLTDTSAENVAYIARWILKLENKIKSFSW